MSDNPRQSDPLDDVLDQLIEMQGRGVDLSEIEITLRERGPVRTEESESQRKTREDMNRASQDAASIIDTEAPAEPCVVMTSDATASDAMRSTDVSEEIARSLGPQLDEDNAAYDEDPDSIRPDDSISVNAAVAAYAAYRAACIAYSKFMVAAASRMPTVDWEPKDTKEVIKGVIIGVVVLLVAEAIGVGSS